MHVVPRIEITDYLMLCGRFLGFVIGWMDSHIHILPKAKVCIPMAFHVQLWLLLAEQNRSKAHFRNGLILEREMFYIFMALDEVEIGSLLGSCKNY